MAITYPLTVPDGYIQSYHIDAQVNSTEVRSIFTSAQSTYLWGSGLWVGHIDLRPMRGADAATWQAFIMSLQGQTGTFLLGDPLKATPLGAGGGSPVVDGADQSGAELAISGAPASVTGWLKAGDHIQVGTGATTHLHAVLKDVNTNGSGGATIDVWPALRGAPANGGAVVINSPKGIWRMTDRTNGWAVAPDKTSKFALAIHEAL